jgi:RimJ/RimL family protein N-acetyltransferase
VSWNDPDLRDDHVALRRWRDSDFPGNLMAFADPEVLRFSWPHEHEYTEADARAYFADQQRAWEAGIAAEFACVEPADDTAVLGGASIYDVEPLQRRASIGYWLAPHARGRGAATHAVRLLARWAVDILSIERLQITCGPDNVASQRVAARAGFTREGVLRSHYPFRGARRDTVVHSLLPTDLGRS